MDDAHLDLPEPDQRRITNVLRFVRSLRDELTPDGRLQLVKSLTVLLADDIEAFKDRVQGRWL